MDLWNITGVSMRGKLVLHGNLSNLGKKKLILLPVAS